MLDETISGGELVEKQTALETLGQVSGEQADEVLNKWLDRLNAGDLPANVWLDLTEAAAKRDNDSIEQKLAAYESSRPADDPLAAWRECLEGGDAERGRAIFYGRTDLSCVRCHTIGEEGTGGRVGPALTEVAKEKERSYLLEAVATPSKTIAKGFEMINLVMADGQILAGIVQEESDQELRLMDPEGKLFTVNKDDIDLRSQGPSAMPEDLIKKLSKPELRDLIEFLSQQK